MRTSLSRFAIAATVAAGLFIVLSSPLPADAVSGDTVGTSGSSSSVPAGPSGTITIEEENPLNHGEPWALLSTTQLSFSGSSLKEDVTIPSGSYTFFVTPPDGYMTEVRLYDGTTLLQSVEHPQITFTYNGQSGMRVLARFTLQDTGKVSVVSTPSGVPYELSGPNSTMLKGVTPGSYDALALGQYSVRYIPVGCPAIPQKSSELRRYGRIDFSVTIVCDSLQRQTEMDDENNGYVSVVIDGKKVVFRDVPVASWFSTYVYGVAKRGISTGYKDDSGELTGQFGPENPVTLAELAKIAHKVAGLNEKTVSSGPLHPSASGWASLFIASAERRDWSVYIDPSVDVNRPASRGEVVATLLQALDVSLHWPKGTIFSDVTRRTPYAAAIETAAMDDIVSGNDPVAGSTAKLFKPEGDVNRAELAKIVTLIIAKYRPEFDAKASSSSSR